jgi:hypothetical protein
LEPRPPEDSSLALFERLASNPRASAAKIERLMSLWERAELRKAESAFNAGMATAQKEMRPVAEDAFNPQTRSKYASYEALDRAIRPIYTKYGFGLSFDTGDSPKDEHVRVLCHVTHKGGYTRPYHVDMPADGKGAKGGDVMTKTHAVGSALSYGQRYLLRMIFNIATADKDDDGNRAGGQRDPEVPPGFDEWLMDLSSVSDSGLDELEAAWNKSKNVFRSFLTTHQPQRWKNLKDRAKKVAVKE